jgi:3alpha(or 20beta)-hydroxysteroid dehydrogenase
MGLFSLDQKVAVVTGGGSGIGLATAKRFVAAGATVVIATRSDNAALARSFGAAYVRADVRREDDVRALIETTVDRHGKIDVLVNNAGYAAVGATVTDLTQQTLLEHLVPNVLGVAYGMKYASQYMKSGSSIINVASLAAVIGFPAYGAYAASKFAVVGLTKTAAIELAPRGIRVNCVCPGTIDTPINQQAGADAELEVVKTVAPLGRIGKPEEVAALMHALAAEDCGYLTGEAVAIDGGWLAGPSIALFERLAGTAAR